MIRRWVFGDGILAEAIRFGLVGIKNNVVYYLLFVVVSLAGAGPKLAVTIIYIFGIIYTFWFNKGFVFRDLHPSGSQFARYIFVYFVGWALNLVLLDITIAQAGVNRYLAQALLIFPLAGLTFLALKLYVFRAQRT